MRRIEGSGPIDERPNALAAGAPQTIYRGDNRQRIMLVASLEARRNRSGDGITGTAALAARERR